MPRGARLRALHGAGGLGGHSVFRLLDRHRIFIDADRRVILSLDLLHPTVATWENALPSLTVAHALHELAHRPPHSFGHFGRNGRSPNLPVIAFAVTHLDIPHRSRSNRPALLEHRELSANRKRVGIVQTEAFVKLRVHFVFVAIQRIAEVGNLRYNLRQEAVSDLFIVQNPQKTLGLGLVAEEGLEPPTRGL